MGLPTPMGNLLQRMRVSETRRYGTLSASVVLAVAAFFVFCAGVFPAPSESWEDSTQTFLGFDRNEYPGDASLLVLRKTFSFCGILAKHSSRLKNKLVDG